MANQPQGNGRNGSISDEKDDERFASRERERMGSQWDDRSARWDDREERNRSTEHYGQGQSGYSAGRDQSDRSYGSRNETNPRGNERYPDRGGDERFSGGRGGGAWRPEDRSMRQPSPGGGGYGQGREGWGDQANYGSPGTINSAVGGRHYGEQGNYRQSEGRDEGGYLGQGGQQMGYRGTERGDRPEHHDMHGGGGVRDQGGMYGQGGYNDGMYGRSGMQNRYGSQGYQGWGQHGQQSPGHRGKGPAGYTRSDDRIREIVCEVLMDDDHIDATNIEVSVSSGEVTLSGTVEDRAQKRMAEDRIEGLSCVKDVVNQLRLGANDRSRSSSTSSTSTSSTTPATRENGHGETPSSSDKRHRA